MEKAFTPFLHVQVRFEGGRWVTPSGLPLYAQDGTVGEFIISEEQAQFVWQGDVAVEESVRPFLGPGAKLLVALSGVDENELPRKQLQFLRASGKLGQAIATDYAIGRRTADCHYFELMIGPANERMKKSHPEFTGGLLVTTQGRSITRISASTIALPDAVSDRVPISLNHALTILSEVYETHRLSHTGNIYEQVFYQEEDGKWYPLAFLRKGYRNGPNPSLARRFWSGN